MHLLLLDRDWELVLVKQQTLIYTEVIFLIQRLLHLVNILNTMEQVTMQFQTQVKQLVGEVEMEALHLV
jgi:hypothetical protein